MRGKGSIRKSTRHNEGMTLVELVVCLGILAVVTGLGSTAFIKMSTVWGDVQEHEKMAGEAERILTVMREDFGSVLSPRVTGIPLAGIENTRRGDGSFYGKSVNDDAISMAVQTPQGQKIVTYRVLREGPGARLVREKRNLRADEADVLITNESKNVLVLQIAYLVNGQEQGRAWSGENLPDAVRVGVVLVDPTNPQIQIVREATFPVRVN